MDALWDFVGPHCLHGRVWVRFKVDFDAKLGPPKTPKSSERWSRGPLRRDPGKSGEKVRKIGPILRP